FNNEVDDIGIFVLIVGVIIHDTTKGSLRLSDSDMSHSKVMKNKPHIAIQEAKAILKDVETFTNYKLKGNIKEQIYHIVASHHGRWGKIKPGSLEANIVHEADKYSAMYHRITPIGARDIIKLMNRGFNKREVVNITGYTKGIINNRLKKARHNLNIKTTKKLLEYYKDTGHMVDGDAFFSRRIRETKKLIKRVDNIGFEKLVLGNNLLKYIDSGDIFK
ncbi:MAG: HD domain-containing protein, partial [Fusobacteriota bacterium]